VFDRGAVLYLYTETPLHPGVGAEPGWVDLPIQREAHTGHPLVQGPGLKGALRSAALRWAEGARRGEAGQGQWKDKVVAVFGPETGNASDHAGCLSVGDAHVLLFPVASFSGVFGWVTCPGVLARYRRDATRAGLSDLPDVPQDPGQDRVWVAERSGLLLDGAQCVALGDVAFSTVRNGQGQACPVAAWAEHLGPFLPDPFLANRLRKNLAVVDDEAFAFFVRHRTEVVTRIRMDPDLGTARERGLWTEELLPPDTLLYAPVAAAPPRTEAPAGLEDGSKVLYFVRGKVLGQAEQPGARRGQRQAGEAQRRRTGLLRLGGGATVGRGLVWAAMEIPQAPGSGGAAQGDRP